MSSRYLLAAEATLDLVEIWRYIKRKTTVAMADRVESVIRDRIGFLAQSPGAGHWRKDFTNEDEVLSGLLVPDRLSS
jgi:plasmid stabilization system protein ParE